MKRLLIVFVAASVVLGANYAFAGESKAKGNSLGVVAGINVPISAPKDYEMTEVYGFFVDLPLLSTFFISPEALIYRHYSKSEDTKYGRGITDLSLNFKFVVPLGSTKINAGMRGGISNGVLGENSWPITFHFGVFGGLDYNIVSNIAICFKAVWEFMPAQEGNIYQMFGLGGIRFTI